jgi:hypothetical protein
VGGDARGDNWLSSFLRRKSKDMISKAVDIKIILLWRRRDLLYLGMHMVIRMLNAPGVARPETGNQTGYCYRAFEEKPSGIL